MKKIFLLLSISLGASSIAHAQDSYALFKSTLTSSVQTGFGMYIQESTVVFHGFFTDDAQRDWIVSETIKALAFAQDYDSDTAAHCYQKDIELHIYFVPNQTINNREVMAFLNWNNWNNKDIYGAFDSLTSPAGTVTIFLASNHSTPTLVLTLAHEIYHYWQFKNCRSLSEPEAIAFEKAYFQ